MRSLTSRRCTVLSSSSSSSSFLRPSRVKMISLSFKTDSWDEAPERSKYCGYLLGKYRPRPFKAEDRRTFLPLPPPPGERQPGQGQHQQEQLGRVVGETRRHGQDAEEGDGRERRQGDPVQPGRTLAREDPHRRRRAQHEQHAQKNGRTAQDEVERRADARKERAR